MDYKILMEIEEYINTRFCNVSLELPDNCVNAPTAFYFMPNDDFYNELDKSLMKKQKGEFGYSKLYCILLEYIARLDRTDFYFKSGDKKGELNGAGFCAYAQIDDSSWSNIKWGTGNIKKETLLKIIVALKLSEQDAKIIMEQGSSGFSDSDFRDQLMLALINCKEWREMDYIVVYEIMERYRNDGLPEHRFKNIYDSPTLKK